MSGSLIGGIVGATIGFVVSGGNPMGAMYGFSVGSMAGGLLFPQHVDGPRLTDLKPQASEYGRPIPIVYGTVALGGNVIWASDYVVEKGQSGGKGGGPVVDTETYYGNFAIAFAEGECSIGRMWAGPEKRLIWDGVTLEGGGKVRFYTGSEDQLPDPLIESYLGVGNVPAYRGTCYVVIEHFPLLKDGDTLPFITAEVGRIAPTAPALPVTIASLATPAFQSPIVAVDPNSKWIWSVKAASLSNTFTVTVLSDRTQEVIWTQAFTAPYGILSVGEITITPDGSQVFILFAPPPWDSRLAMVAEFSPGVANANGGLDVVPQLIDISLWGDPSQPAPIDPATIHATGSNVWVAYAFTNVSNLHLAQFGSVGAHGPGSYIEIFPGFSIGDPAQIVGDDSHIAIYGALGPSTQNVAVINGATGTVVTQLFVPIVGVNGGKPLSFDPTRSRFAAPVSGGITLIDAATGTVTNLTLTLPVEAPGGTPIGMMYDVRLDKYVYAQYGFGANNTSTTIFIVDPVTGTVVSYWTYPVGEQTTGPMLEAQITTGAAYIITFSNTTAYRLYLGGSAASPAALGEVVLDLSLRAGLTADQVDVSALIDIVDGYSIARQTTVRNAIDALRPAYYFDMVERAGKVVAVKRGGAPVATIDADDLDARSEGGAAGDPLLTTRQMEVELPRVVNVNYLLAATDYSPATKLAKRLVGASGSETTLDLPLVLTDTKAQEIADVNLQVVWVQRLTYAFNLPRKYSHLEPTDHIVVKGQGMRLTKATRTPAGVIKCEATADGSTFYTPNTTVTETPSNDKTIYVPGTTALELM